jgi:hypothetical protein
VKRPGGRERIPAAAGSSTSPYSVPLSDGSKLDSSWGCPGRKGDSRTARARRRIHETDDILDTADDEISEGREKAGSLRTSCSGVLSPLLQPIFAERGSVRKLAIWQEVWEAESTPSSRAQEILTTPKFAGEKFIVFTNTVTP